MNITVYCGASKGNQPIYEQAAITLGKWIADRGDALVYGGGKAGLMGILADSVLHNGGSVIGIIPEFLQESELAHPNLTEIHVVGTMSERKTKMADLSEAFIALPGGPGTLEEITEMVSWARIGQNPNPCIFFNINQFYQPIEQFYNQMVTNEFLTADDRCKMLFSDSFETIDTFIQNYEPPNIRQY